MTAYFLGSALSTLPVSLLMKRYGRRAGFSAGAACAMIGALQSVQVGMGEPVLILAFVVIGGLVAAALVFGRSLLFDTGWDAQLTPIVNEIEAERGPFEHPVQLETLAAPEFGEKLRMMTIGAKGRPVTSQATTFSKWK